MTATSISPPPLDTADQVERRDFLQTAAALGLAVMVGPARAQPAGGRSSPDLILRNGRIVTMDRAKPEVSALAIKDGLVMATGGDAELMGLADGKTQVVDARRHRVIPGLIDSHTHILRGGLTYNLELRWDGVRSLGAALEMLKEQARRTPAPQWVRVIGGWSEYQFEERRMPTLKEINDAAPDTPVFVLGLYSLGLLNRAALKAVGYTRDTPQPPGGLIERDSTGEPTGLLMAEPSAAVLAGALAKGPALGPEDQVNSTLQFMREVNRLGITSVGDAAGGGMAYPDNYGLVAQLAKEGRLTVRVAYNVFSQKPKEELADIQRFVQLGGIGQGTDFYKLNGAGENLVFSAADFENFLIPRPRLPDEMEPELEAVVRYLASNGWPWRMHATYNETVTRALNVFEKIDREIPIGKIGWFFDHCETVTPENLERIKKLGGGIAVQNRMSLQGEYFIRRYGVQAAAETPPVTRMLEMEVPVSLGTDGTRVNSYNPWQVLYWLVSGRSIGGTVLYPEEKRLDRMKALALMTADSAWFSRETGKKGVLKPGAFADLALLDKDYLSIPEDQIQDLTSLLTVVGGKIVYGGGAFERLGPTAPPVSPNWSPVHHFGGYQSRRKSAVSESESQRRYHYAAMCACAAACGVHGHQHAFAALAAAPTSDTRSFWGAFGCDCYV